MAKKAKIESLHGCSAYAVITKVKDDRILCTINGLAAAWFVKRGNLNLHTMFRKGERIKVTIIKQCDHLLNALRLFYLVKPQTLPIDIYAKRHPVGTVVDGTIESIRGAAMTVSLAPNVSCITRRCPHARTGQQIRCKIDKYNANQQYLSIRVVG